MPDGKPKAKNRKDVDKNGQSDNQRVRMLEQLLLAKQAELRCAERQLEEGQQLLQVRSLQASAFESLRVAWCS